MAVSYASAGTQAAGTTSVAPSYPVPVPAGSLLVLAVVNKYPNNAPTDPSGWTRVAQTSGGAGASAVDAGSVYVTVYTKIATGGEAGSLSVSVPSGNCSTGQFYNLAKSPLATWDVVASVGSVNAGGSTSWSVTGDVDPQFSANDFCVMISGINGNATATYTSEAISATGATFGAVTERTDSGTANGDDCKLVVATCAVTAGVSTAAPVYTMTASASSTNFPAGATVMLRVRELQPYQLARQLVAIRPALVAASM